MLTASIDLQPLFKKLRQVPREATRIIAHAIETDARGFVRDIIAITPPSQGKADKQSQRRGEAAVMRDIYKVYATPGQIYDQLKALNKGMAAGFWAAVKVKNWTEANRICRRAGVKELEDFTTDDGAAHQARRRMGRVTGQRPSMAVRDQRYLKKYVRHMQLRVGLMAAGFKPAGEKLKVKMPAWVLRHRASGIGTIKVHHDISRFSITISNKARHGRANDLPRRMAYVLASEKRKKRLANSIRYNIRAVLKQQRVGV